MLGVPLVALFFFDIYLAASSLPSIISMVLSRYYGARQSARLRMGAVVRREVKDFICGCESLLCAVECGKQFSPDEVRLIELYAEVIQQSSVSGLIH